MKDPGISEVGSDLKNRLSAGLRRPLPGISAQNQMAPLDRVLPEDSSGLSDIRRSAVLLLITRDLELIYIHRADNGGRHSGQIAFPGGMEEAEDKGAEDTALRETYEEIGIPPDSVETAGYLSPLHIPISRVSVQPIVGWLTGPSVFRPEPGEVDDVLMFPINALCTGRTEARVKRHFGEGLVPCYRMGRTVIWGATAMITAEFLAVWEHIVPLS